MTNGREVRDYLNKAREELAAAESLLSGAHTAAALSRTYYAMYHATQGLLLSIGKSYSSHKASINGFSQHFVKTGAFSRDYFKRLTRAFELRMEGDYDPTSGIDSATAKEIYGWAEDFLAAAEEYLNKD